MEYDGLLEDMKKSREEKDLFSNMISKMWTDKGFTRKVINEIVRGRLKEMSFVKDGVAYIADCKSMKDRLKKMAEAYRKVMSRPTMTKWWRAVYEWQQEKEMWPKGDRKYKEFSELFVCPCVEGETVERVRSRIQKVNPEMVDAKTWQGWMEQLDRRLGDTITEIGPVPADRTDTFSATPDTSDSLWQALQQMKEISW